MKDWKQTFLERLAERDEFQHSNGCSDTLLYMSERIEKYRARCEELKSDNFAIDLDRALSKIKDMNIQLDLNHKILKEKETVNNDLIVAFGTAKKDKESIRELYKKLEDRYTKLQEEMAMSKKTINVINDHILELQFENNMLQASLNSAK
ncbi:hypothetical protein PICMEDRAFT_59983 [Pichia membranifaciens NRRL Y-2026]|uniref:Autophagy-related protein 16 domain-containing protein n=1 Tax=Pichia membranifaciens NRRL Y-2026 TaxID=763406 RepID=A0A1E3NGD3_9ASCO|nr:hypothetical protein PICMEDRAFT_59983 [Pichia membranifaciens NRRL Y-2026]ODQ45184.1 hypothetical protein PICMEDRAFT_59983 [Pichia membranifaciens NRRL Y-2026]